MMSMRRAESSSRSFGTNGVVGEALDDRVPAALDIEHGVRHELRRAPLESACPLGKRGERIELGERGRRGLQRREAVRETSQDVLVELLLARQGPLARAEDPILEALQLRGDESLRGFDGLSPDVVLGRALRVLARDLDEEALHAVVAELQPRDAGALALALLELEEEIVRVGRDLAQLIELGVVTCRDHIAIPQERRRLLRYRVAEEGDDVGVLADAARKLGDERRVDLAQHRLQSGQRRKRGAKLGQVPRPRRP